jgi:hypothetical protein
VGGDSRLLVTSVMVINPWQASPRLVWNFSILHENRAKPSKTIFLH